MQAAGLVLTAYQDSLSRSLDIVANNVANSNTTGFKKQSVQFETLVSRPTLSDIYAFGVDKGTFRDIAQGPMLTTGNPLDIAIQGKGYFPIQTKSGIRYTRSGSFTMDGESQIVTASGDKLLGDGDQPITVPEDADDLNITADGVITVKSGTGTDVLQIGKLKLVKFAREQDMQIVGNNLYTTTQQPEAVIESVMVQGMVENSNVQAVSEITNMVSILRNYQIAVHLLDLENQRMKDSINRLSKATA